MPETARDHSVFRYRFVRHSAQGELMEPQLRQQTVDISAAPRAVLSTAADLIYRVGRSVLGENKLPTAQANAWAAVCADQRRARERAEVQRWLDDKRRHHLPNLR
jgi:hypothetical protein